MAIIVAVSFSHMLNDIMQSLLAAIYPILKDSYSLDFWQIGLLTLTFQITASLLQPVIGIYTDKRPMPYSLPVGMGSTLVGLVVLAYATNYPLLLIGAAFIGFGSAVFHPEASRVARMASGGRYGLAQSLFQVGGNFGQSLGPLLAAFIVVPGGQRSLVWFSFAALVGMIVLTRVSVWYSANRVAPVRRASHGGVTLTRGRIGLALFVLMLLTFSKNIYMASISSYYTFYVIEVFGVSVQNSQLLLFLFLVAAAIGTIVGGPIGDRFGPRFVIWFSILGALPFTLALPYVGLFWTAILSFVIGVVMASAFPAIVVFAQELIPGRVGLVAGVFFGFAFGMGGIAAAVLGIVADHQGIEFVYKVCSYLPLIGLLTIFLPRLNLR
ncbi:MAG: MFS transporter [Rhizobiales bacterium]|nr:MFS transporter [Hyphomicrobiales bacterium]